MTYNMSMYKANIVEIKNNLKYFLDLVLQGKGVVIMRRNVPIAQIVPAGGEVRNKTTLGCGRGTARVQGKLTEGLIPESDWEMLR